MSESPPRSSASGEDIPTVSSAGLGVGLGMQIGPYKLLSVLGAGGLGVVYLAEQYKPIKRRVALKVIKPGMDSKSVLARFDAERQALALLNHVNIAKVFDAGMTEAGRPYFIMEYVKGVPITEYCDREKLGIEDRLGLFICACEAIQHAHQKGIIHRDIKPSNILVADDDGKAVLKIIDFGIAKAISQPLTDRTLFTEVGQVIGTPEYMSPEQAELVSQDVDTRTDIYSLGVLLYELLTGRLPFDSKTLRVAALSEMQRVIREQEPPRPSTCLADLGEAANDIAQKRRTNLQTLARRLHRELEWIPLKAMAKERTRRYRSASELADDIHNYLEGSPLIAGPESISYRTQKFIRRNRSLVIGTFAVATALVVGLIVSTAMYIRAEQSRRREVDARRAIERANYFNTIALAEALCNQNDTGRVRRLLAGCPDDMRDWEWYRLWQLCHAEKTVLQGRHGWVHAVAVTPDGQKIISGSSDGAITVWNMADASEVITLRGHSEGVRAVCISPDGRLVASGGDDKTVKVWDMDKAHVIMTLVGHTKLVGSIAFSPDGHYLVSGSEDGTARIWDTEQPDDPEAVLQHEVPVNAAVFSPDGESIATGAGADITLWDSSKRAEVWHNRLAHDVDVCAVCFTPSGERLVSGSMDGTVRVWNANDGSMVMTLAEHLTGPRDLRKSYEMPAVRSVDVSGDGKYIVSGSQDSSIKVWDATEGIEVRTLRGHESDVDCVTFSPSGRYIVSGGRDGAVRVWDVTASSELVLRTPMGNSLLGFGGHPVTFSPDGKFIALGFGFGSLQVWNATTGAEVLNLEGHKGSVLSVSYSPDSLYLVSGGDDATVRLWEINSGDEEKTLHGHEGYVMAAFSHDGEQIVSSGQDGTIRLWDVSTGTPMLNLRHAPKGFAVASLSPDDQSIVSAGEDGVVKVWDVNNGDETLVFPGHSDSVLCVLFSPDGQRIASVSKDDTIKIWDVASGTVITTLCGYQDLSTMTLSPSGDRLVSGDMDGRVKIWDTASGFEIMTLRGHSSPINSIEFGPDRRRMLTADLNGTVMIWGAASPQGIAEP